MYRSEDLYRSDTARSLANAFPDFAISDGCLFGTRVRNRTSAKVAPILSPKTNAIPAALNHDLAHYSCRRQSELIRLEVEFDRFANILKGIILRDSRTRTTRQFWTPGSPVSRRFVTL